MKNLLILAISLKGEVKRPNWFYMLYFFVLKELHVHCPCMSQGIAFDENPHENFWNSVTMCSDLIVLT